MPRAIRLQEAGLVHHVVCRGNDKQDIFKFPQDYKAYLALLDEARRKYPIKIYNYVLMSNHLHILLEPCEEGSLSRVMEEVSKGYAKHFNKEYGRSGHVFQGRFKSFLIQTEKYFFACSRYIDLNPLKANLVSDPKDYLWSGYKSLAFGKDSSLKIDFHEIYNNLGKTANERQISYKALVMVGGQEELTLLERKAGVLGDADFRAKFKK